MMPEMYMLVGISAGGKSSIRKELAEKRGAVICSSDDIRGEICPGGVQDQTMNQKVFSLLFQRMQAALKEKKNVVVDATNINRKSRASVLRAVGKIPCRKIALVLTKPEEQCQADNVDRPHPVPDWVIRKQICSFEIPFLEEGFDEIRLIPWDPSFSEDVKSVFEAHPFRSQIPAHAWGEPSLSDLLSRMKTFDQRNRYHTMTLGDHCQAVAESFEKTEYDKCLKDAAKIHDIGKLFTQTFDEEGRGHFYSHENVGAYFVLSHRKMVEEYFGPMTDEEFHSMVYLINYHMLPMYWKQDKTVRKYEDILGKDKAELLRVFHECDVNGK